MHRTLSSALIAVAVLALGSIAQPVAAAQEIAPDPAQQAAASARQDAAAAAPRFDPSIRACTQQPHERDARRWTTTAPREAAHPSSIITLGVSGGAANQDVTATVTAPDGSQLAVSDWLTQRGSTGLAYPIGPALPGPESTVPGTYTVVWTDSASGAFLACDGFVVER